MPLISSSLPQAYEGLYFVVLLIGFTRLLEAIIGIGNAVLIFSNSYTSFLIGALIFGILGVYLNVSIIPVYGINGAALATTLTLLGFFYL
jgi:O-antigen/teichoic acid export membrane protein